jgi:hypothetical protein
LEPLAPFAKSKDELEYEKRMKKRSTLMKNSKTINVGSFMQDIRIKTGLEEEKPKPKPKAGLNEHD